MKGLQKTLIIVSHIIKLSLIFAIAGALLTQQWFTLFLSIVTLILTFLPSIIEKNYKIYLPLELELVMTLFIYSSLYLGEIHSYYIKYWWWDILLHTSSSIILGFIGFLIVFILNYEEKVKMYMSPKIMAVFAFTFALSIGSIWEIVEFSIDNLLGTNMQKSGLVDTMWDLIVDTIGALIVSISSYFYVKNVRVPVFDTIIEKFIDKNPAMFVKRLNAKRKIKKQVRKAKKLDKKKNKLKKIK